MQLIIISHPNAVANEAEIINALFDEGLELFHLRKPNFSEQELITLLEKINANYYSRIAIHNHHSIAQNFDINRIHFSENKRLTATEEELDGWKKKKCILSTSIHSMNDYELVPEIF